MSGLCEDWVGVWIGNESVIRLRSKFLFWGRDFIIIGFLEIVVNFCLLEMGIFCFWVVFIVFLIYVWFSIFFWVVNEGF